MGGYQKKYMEEGGMEMIAPMYEIFKEKTEYFKENAWLFVGQR